MILTFDIGNTRAKFALFDDGKILHNGYLPTMQLLQFPDLNLQFPNVTKWQVMISCVVDVDRQKFTELLQKLYQTQPHWLSVQSPLPFAVQIKNAQTVGADRLANVAAVSFKKGSWLVIDMGTFLTLDYLLENQGFVGGVIFPGISTTQMVYSEKASKLPSFVLQSSDACFGDDTLSAMQVGLYQSYKYILQGFIKDFAKRTPGTLQVVATGGGWPILQAAFPDVPYNADLTLQGLHNLATMTKETKL